MGYQPPTYRLVFEDPTLDGLEVRTRGASIEHIATWQSVIGQGIALVQPEGAEYRGKVCDLLADRIIDWNLEDEQGQPVPVTSAAIAEQDWTLLLKIGRAWLAAAAGVSRPLEPDSPSGQPFPEESIPMETSSSSPQN